MSQNLHCSKSFRFSKTLPYISLLISLTKSSVSSFKTNRILVELQTYCKYLSGGIYRYWSCPGFSKLRLRFFKEEYIISSNPSVFKLQQLHRNLSHSYFVEQIQTTHCRAMMATVHCLTSFRAGSYRAESLRHCVSALPVGLRICICSPQCTSTYRVARSLLSARLCSAFSFSTDNSISNMGLSSPSRNISISDITLRSFVRAMGQLLCFHIGSGSMLNPMPSDFRLSLPLYIWEWRWE